MNRKQRRALIRQSKKINDQKPAEDIRETSLTQLIVALNSILLELTRRGIALTDFDYPERRLIRIQIKHGIFYALLGRDDEEG